MLALLQRVSQATLTVEGKLISSIQKGMVVYLGVKKGDDFSKANSIVKKISQARIFEDENGKTNLNIQSVNGEILLVSQFTLYGSLKGTNRPDFTMAEEPIKANNLYNYVATELQKLGHKVKLGVFGADMKISQQNDGPFSVLIEF